MEPKSFHKTLSGSRTQIKDKASKFQKNYTVGAFCVKTNLTAGLCLHPSPFLIMLPGLLSFMLTLMLFIPITSLIHSGF